jgi:hypothetical protein
MLKQKTLKDYLTSLMPPQLKTGELHPVKMNYMGPNTKLEERVSLNYKGKVGTENYFLPSTLADYFSFFHDLSYYVPLNIINLIGDIEYLENLENHTTKDYFSKLGKQGIELQTIKRISQEKLKDREIVEATAELGYKFLNQIYEIRKKFDKYLAETVIVADFLVPEDLTPFIPKKQSVLMGMGEMGQDGLNDKFLVKNFYFTDEGELKTEEKKKKLYVDFYEEVKKFFDMVNNLQRELGYKPYDFPPLNEKNLPLVSKISYNYGKELKTDDIDKIFEENNQKLTIEPLFFEKLHKQEQVIDEDLKKELKKVMKNYYTDLETENILRSLEQNELENFLENLYRLKKEDEPVIQQEDLDKDIVNILSGVAPITKEEPMTYIELEGEFEGYEEMDNEIVEILKEEL